MLQTVAIRTPKHLCIKDNSLIIREKGSSVVLGKIALSDIWVIIIDNPQVTITSALISRINDAGIGVLYCGSDHMPNGLALPLGAHSRHAEIVEHQLAISKPLRNQIWKRIVTKKIENQAKALALCFGDSAEVKKIRGYAQEVQTMFSIGLNIPPEAIAHVLMETRSHAALPPMTHQLRFQVWVKGITPLSSSTTSFPISRRAISPTDGLNAPASEAAPSLLPRNSAPAHLYLSQVYRDRASIAR